MCADATVREVCGVRPCWWRVFPGEAVQLRAVRRWIEHLLPQCPDRDDVTEVACELAANAVRHTLSGSGGQFSVCIACEPGKAVVSVADEGGTGEPRLVDGPPAGHGPLTGDDPLTLAGHGPLAEHGRGLHIICALADRVTVTGGARGRTVRAEVAWQVAPGAPKLRC